MELLLISFNIMMKVSKMKEIDNYYFTSTSNENRFSRN